MSDLEITTTNRKITYTSAGTITDSDFRVSVKADDQIGYEKLIVDAMKADGIAKEVGETAGFPDRARIEDPIIKCVSSFQEIPAPQHTVPESAHINIALGMKRRIPERDIETQEIYILVKTPDGEFLGGDTVTIEG